MYEKRGYTITLLVSRTEFKGACTGGESAEDTRTGLGIGVNRTSTTRTDQRTDGKKGHDAGDDQRRKTPPPLMREGEGPSKRKKKQIKTSLSRRVSEIQVKHKCHGGKTKGDGEKLQQKSSISFKSRCSHLKDDR